jgi:UDP-2,3-diacylglucosamine pyrophosphatase LpxH
MRGERVPGKFKIVVSDLHLGAGREAEGNKLEDFGSDRQFAELLGGIGAESKRERLEVELIVNGDAFEMLQVPHVDSFDPKEVYRPEQYHSSSRTDSARKMALIIAGHPQVFKALGQFIQASFPRRTVTFIKGNHDVDLHWTAVQDRIRLAMGAIGRRAPLVTFEERRISRDGIYVEHGNQYAEFLSRLEDMEEPHDHDDPEQLALPIGSWFSMDVFNPIEREKYWVDGVKPISALVWYSLVYDFAFAARAVAWLLRALPSVIEEGILMVRDPRVDLVRHLEDPSRVKELAARYEADEGFRGWLNAEVARMLPAPPANTSAQALATADPFPGAEAMGDRIRQQVHSSLFRAACTRAIEEGVKLVVFGHTHEPGVEFMPNGGTYINSGTWTWSGDFGEVGKETWKDLFEHPERFTDDRRLCYIRIDYDDEGQPLGKLLSYDTGQRLGVPRPSWWRRLVAYVRGLWRAVFGDG